MNIYSFLLAVPLLGIIGCNITDHQSPSLSFAIYRLKDSTLMASQIWDSPIENLQLTDSPFLSQDSILSYKWKSHEFAVAASIDTQLSYIGTHLGPIGGIPFVVTVGRDRIYIGALWFPHSSWSPMCPYIEPWSNPHRIQKSWDPKDSVDKRNDPRIYVALKNAGVLIE